MKKPGVLALLALHAGFGFGFPTRAATHAETHASRTASVSMPASSAAAKAVLAEALDNDKTLRAMHDEMERARTRLEIANVGKPFYVEYRLLDLDVRSVTASFGALLASGTTRNRFMSVDVRVGDYHLDSSNFISEDGFQGFLGSTGQVGIDRDYNSLRQDLWLATDQAFKAAVTEKSLKDAFLRSLTKPPEIDDFSQEPPVVKIDPRIEPDWTSRKWEDEARSASAVLKTFPDLYGTRVNYYLVYMTEYLMNSEGTSMRTTRSLAAVEAALDTQADDGMALHNSYAVYVRQPSELPDPQTVSKGIAQAGSTLMQLRASPLVQDFTGPVLFDPAAAGLLLSQVLEASLSGARPQLSMVPRFDEIMEGIGGRSEWVGRVGTRVLPPSVSVVDDPKATEFEGQPLLGGYDVDDEGVNAQRISIVDHGVLKNQLMSRRPGPDFGVSNGHARSALLSDPKALSSNLFLQSSEGLDQAAMRKKFLAACREDGHEWCIKVKRMDNPALSSVRQEDFTEFISALAGAIGGGERIPLLVYRVYVADGREELVRGARITGLTLRSLRNMMAIGSDNTVYTFMQNPSGGFAGTALGAYGGAQGGIPSTVIAPSLLLEEVEIRGFHGEPRRLPVVPIPPMR